MSRRQHWLDEAADAGDYGRIQRRGGLTVAMWIVSAVIFFGLLSIAVWYFGVRTSGIKGRGDATRTKNAAVNRIAQQEGFEDRHADVLAADERIDVLAAAAALDPKDLIVRTNLTGARTYCLRARAEYDAQARKFSAAEFRAADLPAQIDKTDPATDCRETENR